MRASFIRRSAASLVLVGSLGGGIALGATSTPAGATTTFCKLILKYKAPNATGGVAEQKSWAKANLPFMEKLEAAAPNAKTKASLKSLVAILKYEDGSSNNQSLTLYLAKNVTALETDYTALANSIVACA